MKRMIIAASALAAAVSLAACQPGEAEKAGENADSAYEETTTGQKDLTDGPLENAGEAIDAAAADAKAGAKDAGNAIEREANQAKEDINKATDGNPKT